MCSRHVRAQLFFHSRSCSATRRTAAGTCRYTGARSRHLRLISHTETGLRERVPGGVRSPVVLVTRRPVQLREYHFTFLRVSILFKVTEKERGRHLGKFVRAHAVPCPHRGESDCPCPRLVSGARIGRLTERRERWRESV